MASSESSTSKPGQAKSGNTDSLMDLFYDHYYFEENDDARLESDYSNNNTDFIIPFELDLVGKYDQMIKDREEQTIEPREIVSAAELSDINTNTINMASDWGMEFTASDLGESVDNAHFCEVFSILGRSNSKPEKRIMPPPDRVPDVGRLEEKRPKVIVSSRTEARDEGLNTDTDDRDIIFSLMVEKETRKQVLVKHRRGETPETALAPDGFELGSVKLLDQKSEARKSSPAVPQVLKPGASPSMPRTSNALACEPIPRDNNAMAIEPIPRNNNAMTSGPTPRTNNVVASEPTPRTSNVLASEPIPRTNNAMATASEPTPRTNNTLASEPIPHPSNAPANETSKKLNSLNDLMQTVKQGQFQQDRILSQQRSSESDSSNESSSMEQESSSNGQDETGKPSIVPQTPGSPPKMMARVFPIKVSGSPPQTVDSPVPNLSLQKGIPALLECKFCQKTFPRHHDHALRVHMIVSHNQECSDELLQQCVKLTKDVRRCRKCNIVVSFKLTEHMLKCQPSATSIDALFEPVNEATVMKNFFLHKCGICQETFALKYELKTHVQTTHTSVTAKMIMEPFFRCAQCLVVMKSSEDLGKHCILCTDQQPRDDTIIALAKRLLHCDFCGKEHESLLRTSRCYIQKSVFRCILCLAVLKEKETINNHMLTYHLPNANLDPLAQNIGKLYCPICRFGPGKYPKIFPHIIHGHLEPALEAYNAAQQKLLAKNQGGNGVGKTNSNSSTSATAAVSATAIEDPLADSNAKNNFVNSTASTTATRPTPPLQPLGRPSPGAGAVPPQVMFSNANRVKIGPVIISTNSASTPSVTKPRNSVITTGNSSPFPIIVSSANQGNPATPFSQQQSPSVQTQKPTATRYWSPPTGTTVTTVNSNSVQQLRIQGNNVQTVPIQVKMQFPPSSNSPSHPPQPPVVVIGTPAQASSSPAVTTMSMSAPVSLIASSNTVAGGPPRIVMTKMQPDVPMYAKANEAKVSDPNNLFSAVGLTRNTTPSTPKSATPAPATPVGTTGTAASSVITRPVVMPPQKESQQAATALTPTKNSSESLGRPVELSRAPSTPVSSNPIPNIASASTTTSTMTSSSSSAATAPLGTHQSSSGFTAVKHTSNSSYGIPGIQDETLKSVTRMLTSKPTTPDKPRNFLAGGRK